MSKNKLFLFALIAGITLIMTGCTTMHEGLPRVRATRTEVNGAHMAIKPVKSQTISGELIAVKDSVVYVLTDKGALIQLQFDDIKMYSVYFGSPDRRYGWTYAVFPTLAISHGIWMIFTIPINLIAAGSVTMSAWQEVTYTEKELPLDQLHIAARFPQGIPATITLSEIK